MSVKATKIIFNSTTVALRLNTLKIAAPPGTAWWTPALRIGWDSLRDGNQGCKWGPVVFTSAEGVSGELLLRLTGGEKHTGQIMPITDAAVAELTAKNKNAKFGNIEKRPGKPAVAIQKWSVQVKTASDGLTIPTGADGKPILPGDDKLSAYYQVASLVNEAFMAEARERIDRGSDLVAKAKEMFKANKDVKADAVLAAFAASLPTGRRPGDTILSSEQVTDLRRMLKDEANGLLRDVIVAGNTRVVSLTQEFISDKAKANAGKPMPNPITRLNINFNKETGIAETSIFDKSKPYSEGGKTRYEAAKVDGVPVNAENVHRFIVSGSIIEGIAKIDLCFSNMGISLPTKIELPVVSPPVNKGLDEDDVFGDEDPMPTTTAAPTTAAPVAAPTTAAAMTAPAVAAPAAETVTDYDSLLGELQGPT